MAEKNLYDYLANQLSNVNMSTGHVSCHLCLFFYLTFLYHMHLHKYLWFSHISCTVAYQAIDIQNPH